MRSANARRDDDGHADAIDISGGQEAPMNAPRMPSPRQLLFHAGRCHGIHTP